MTEARARLCLALCGLATSILAALANVGLDNLTDLNIFTLSVWTILPVGACCVGIVAASGYYFGAIYLDRRPTESLLAQMVAVAVFTQFLIYYLAYLSVFDDGGAAAAQSFLEFMNASLTRSHARDFSILAQAATDELGGFAYPIAALQFFGLICGSVTVYCFLRAKQYCVDCGRYSTLLQRVEKFFDGHVPAIAYFDALTTCAVDGSQFAEVIQRPAPPPGKFRSGDHRVDTLLFGCPGCHKQVLENTVWTYEGHDWEQDNVHYLDADVPAGTDLLLVLR